MVKIKPKVNLFYLTPVTDEELLNPTVRIVPRDIKRADILLRKKLIEAGYLLISNKTAEIGNLEDLSDEPQKTNLPIDLNTGIIKMEPETYRVDYVTLAFIRIETGWKEPEKEHEITLRQQAIK